MWSVATEGVTHTKVHLLERRLTSVVQLKHGEQNYSCDLHHNDLTSGHQLATLMDKTWCCTQRKTVETKLFLI